jgi:hypothetical protein
MNSQYSKFHAFAVFAFGLGLAGPATLAGCDVPQAGVDLETNSEATAESAQALVDLGAQIADHPLFLALSNRVSQQYERNVVALSQMSAAQVQATVSQLQQCAADPQASGCAALLQSLGVLPAEVAENAEDARQIAMELGIDALDEASRFVSFRHAQLIHDGAGSSSELVSLVLDAGVTCAGDCLATLGNVLGSEKGTYLAGMASPPPSSSMSGDDEGGGTIIIVAAVIAIGALFGKLEDVIWNSDEVDKECEDDADCANNEFCHKTGDNDCRPALDEGALCTRNAQCLSNCCKPYIGTGFLPSCRPANKCD